MEEKIQSVQYRDSEPSEFTHKPPKQEMDLSCLSEQISAIRVPLRFDSVDLGIVYIVASSFSVLVAFAVRNVVGRVSWSRWCRSVVPAYFC